MTALLLVVHLLIALALVGSVLLQRSEGGALGIGGGGGGMGGFMSGRGAANVLTRTTAVLAVCFFITSILLTMTAGSGGGGGSSVISDDAPILITPETAPLPVEPLEDSIEPDVPLE
jgi:preprotein translocase subunit SecG